MIEASNRPYIRLADEYGVKDSLLDSAFRGHRATIEYLKARHAGRAAAWPHDPAFYPAPDGHIEPVNAAAKTAGARTERHIHPVPAEPVQATPATTVSISEHQAEAVAAEPEPEKAAPRTAWVDRYTEVHSDVFLAPMTPKWALVTTLWRRFEGVTHQVYKPVTALAEMAGEKPSTVLGWARNAHHPLWTQFSRPMVKKRTDDETGETVIYWEMDVRRINRNEDGTLVSAEDHFIQVPHWWLYEDPAEHDGEWVRRADVDARALWVAATLKKRTAGRAGVKKAAHYLAADSGVSKDTWDRGAATAEAAGLYLHRGSRSGREAAYRIPAPAPVADGDRTHGTRRPNPKRPLRSVTTIPVAVTEVDPFDQVHAVPF